MSHERLGRPERLYFQHAGKPLEDLGAGTALSCLYFKCNSLAAVWKTGGGGGKRMKAGTWRHLLKSIRRQ